MKIRHEDIMNKYIDLFELQENFCIHGEPFSYFPTNEELEWVKHYATEYEVADYFLSNYKNGAINFNCPFELAESMMADGLSVLPMDKETTLYKLVYWCYIDEK